MPCNICHVVFPPILQICFTQQPWNRDIIGFVIFVGNITIRAKQDSQALPQTNVRKVPRKDLS